MEQASATHDEAQIAAQAAPPLQLSFTQKQRLKAQQDQEALIAAIKAAILDTLKDIESKIDVLLSRSDEPGATRRR